jgi:hypothetical protein
MQRVCAGPDAVRQDLMGACRTRCGGAICGGIGYGGAGYGGARCGGCVQDQMSWVRVGAGSLTLSSLTFFTFYSMTFLTDDSLTFLTV